MIDAGIVKCFHGNSGLEWTGNVVEVFEFSMCTFMAHIQVCSPSVEIMNQVITTGTSMCK